MGNSFLTVHPELLKFSQSWGKFYQILAIIVLAYCYPLLATSYGNILLFWGFLRTPGPN